MPITFTPSNQALAVVWEAAETLRAADHGGLADELQAAHAALAELVDAGIEVGAIECGAHVARLNIALARVGGAA